MDRGRPRKRSDGTPIGGTHKRDGSKRSISAERRAFEILPQGWKPADAVKNLDASEVSYLQKQALGQVLRFEVLKKDDVESLSKVNTRFLALIKMQLTTSRNFVILMNELSIFVAPILLYVLDAEISIAAFANICDLLAWLNLATSRCSSRRKPLLS